MMPRIRVGSVVHAQQQTRVPVNESSTLPTRDRRHVAASHHRRMYVFFGEVRSER